MRENYVSIYEGYLFDRAMQILLNLDREDDFFGWVTIPSSINNKININTIIDPGNYVIHYYDNGITGKLVRPLSLRVREYAGELYQFVVIGYDTYYRPFDVPYNTFTGSWQFVSDSATIHKSTTPPPHPTAKTLWLKLIDDTVVDGLYMYNEVDDSWIEIANDDYMSETVYDGKKRRVSFDEYAKGRFNSRLVDYGSTVQAKNIGGNIFSDMNVTDVEIDYGPRYTMALGKLGGLVKSSINDNQLIGPWTMQPSTISTNLENVSYINNTYIAVGDNGRILTSSDGVEWTKQVVNTIAHLRGLIYNTTQYIVVGYNGTIVSSVNMVDWVIKTVGTDSLRDITFNPNTGQCVAVGSRGTILTSSDGITWTKRDSGTTETLYTLTYGNNQYVVIGANGTILTSSNGITWTKRDGQMANTLRGIIWTNGHYVVVGTVGIILTSPDGIVWTKRTSGLTSTIYGISCNEDRCLAVGSGGILITSNDCINWGIEQKPVVNTLSGICYGDNRYVVVGDSGVISTSNTNAWKNIVVPFTEYEDIFYHKKTNEFIVVVNKSLGLFHRASDGILWNTINQISDVQLIKRIHGDVFFFTPNNIYSTRDFLKWDITPHNLSTMDVTVKDVVYSNGYYYILDDKSVEGNTYYISWDLFDWRPMYLPISGIWDRILAGVDKLFIIGKDIDGTDIVLSSTGPEYALVNKYYDRDESDDGAIYDIVYGRPLTEEDIAGITWTESDDSFGLDTVFINGVFHDLNIPNTLRYTSEMHTTRESIINIDIPITRGYSADISIIPTSIGYKSDSIYFVSNKDGNYRMHSVINETLIDTFHSHINDASMHISGMERDRFNSKLEVSDLRDMIDNLLVDGKAYTDGKIAGIGLDGFSDSVEELSDELYGHIYPMVGDGRNLIIGGDVQYSTADYLVNKWVTKVALKPNTKYTIIYKGSITKGQRFRWHGNNGLVVIADSPINLKIGVYKQVVTTPSNISQANFSAYNYPSENSNAGVATIEWIALFEGDNLESLWHTNQIEKDLWNSKALDNHTHISDNKVQISGEDITSGIIDIARLPQEVFDKIIMVSSNEERLNLKKPPVFNGDVIRVYNASPEYTSTIKYYDRDPSDGGLLYNVPYGDPLDEWYKVYDDTKLDSDDGYIKFSKSSESTTGFFEDISNTPTTIAGYGITDLYTKTETDIQVNNMTPLIQGQVDALILSLDNHEEGKIKDRIQNRYNEYDLSHVRIKNLTEPRFLQTVIGNNTIPSHPYTTFEQMIHDSYKYAEINNKRIKNVLNTSNSILSLLND